MRCSEKRETSTVPFQKVVPEQVINWEQSLVVAAMFVPQIFGLLDWKVQKEQKTDFFVLDKNTEGKKSE